MQWQWLTSNYSDNVSLPLTAVIVAQLLWLQWYWFTTSDCSDIGSPPLTAVILVHLLWLQWYWFTSSDCSDIGAPPLTAVILVHHHWLQWHRRTSSDCSDIGSSPQTAVILAHFLKPWIKCLSLWSLQRLDIIHRDSHQQVLQDSKPLLYHSNARTLISKTILPSQHCYLLHRGSYNKYVTQCHRKFLLIFHQVSSHRLSLSNLMRHSTVFVYMCWFVGSVRCNLTGDCHCQA